MLIVKFVCETREFALYALIWFYTGVEGLRIGVILENFAALQ